MHEVTGFRHQAVLWRHRWEAAHMPPTSLERRHRTAPRCLQSVDSRFRGNDGGGRSIVCYAAPKALPPRRTWYESLIVHPHLFFMCGRVRPQLDWLTARPEGP
jgi:hypothetical protein